MLRILTNKLANNINLINYKHIYGSSNLLFLPVHICMMSITGRIFNITDIVISNLFIFLN